MSNRVVCPSHPDANLIEDCHAGKEFLKAVHFPGFAFITSFKCYIFKDRLFLFPNLIAFAFAISMFVNLRVFLPDLKIYIFGQYYFFSHILIKR